MSPLFPVIVVINKNRRTQASEKTDAGVTENTGVTHVPALSFCLRDSEFLRVKFLYTFGSQLNGTLQRCVRTQFRVLLNA